MNCCASSKKQKTMIFNHEDLTFLMLKKKLINPSLKKIFPYLSSLFVLHKKIQSKQQYKNPTREKRPVFISYPINLITQTSFKHLGLFKKKNIVIFFLIRNWWNCSISSSCCIILETDPCDNIIIVIRK
jgi:hypothetical protein